LAFDATISGLISLFSFGIGGTLAANSSFGVTSIAAKEGG